MNARQIKLLERLRKAGSLDASEASRLFGVSAMTMWRDFKIFVDQGIAMKVYGGVVSTEKRIFSPMESQSSDYQKAIAKSAIGMLPDKCTIMLSTGTTAFEMARQLVISGRTHTTVVTNSIPAALLFYQTDFNVILLGGSMRRNSMDIAGPLAEKCLEDLHIDMLFTGCDGAISDEGFFTSDLSIAELERKSVQRTKSVVVITESIKFGKRSLAKFASPRDVSTIITDGRISQSELRKLGRSGITVIKV